jgi:hypothetical protein
MVDLLGQLRDTDLTVKQLKEKMMEMDKFDMLLIHSKAIRAAEKATAEFIEEYGEPLYCGFAWVDVSVERSNSKLANLLKSVGFKRSWLPKRVQLWDPVKYHGQSMDVKEAGCRAYAEVLREHGIDAYMSSRPD